MLPSRTEGQAGAQSPPGPLGCPYAGLSEQLAALVLESKATSAGSCQVQVVTGTRLGCTHRGTNWTVPGVPHSSRGTRRPCWVGQL